MGNIQHLATWWDEAGILRQEIGFILQAVLAHSFPDVLKLFLLDLFPDILSLKQNEWLSSIELMALDGVSGGFLFDKAGGGRSAPFHYAEDNCSTFCAQALLQFRRPQPSSWFPSIDPIQTLYASFFVALRLKMQQSCWQMRSKDLNNRKVIQTAGTCRLSMSHDLSVWLKVGEINKTYFCHQFAHYVLDRLQKLRLIKN